MEHFIDIQNAMDPALIESSHYLPGNEQVETWVNKALSELSAISEITIRVVDANEIQTLNHLYRKKNKPTNVLSFPADIPDEVELNLLGDIVICSSVVEKEAEEQQKPLEAHWAHMVIHGTLHLLGYDHLKSSEALEMESKEIEILGYFGYPSPYLIEEAKTK